MFLKKFLFLSIFCVFIIAGCRTKITDTLGAFIKENCKLQTPCKIEISKITPFSWDEFYFFDAAILDIEVNKILGQKVFSAPFSGYTHRLVFLKNGKVVYQEEEPADLEGKLNGEIYFELNQAKKYAKFSENALFDVQKLKSSDGEHYLLNCINCN